MSSIISIGNNSVREIAGGEHDFDPAIGYTNVRLYEGDEESLVSMAAGFNSKGWKSTVYHHAGPVHRMRVQIAKVPLSEIETPVDTFGWDTELAQESIFSNPQVLAAAGSDDEIARWKASYKEPLKESKLPSTLTTFSAEQLELYTLLLRGQEAVEVERLVLRRTRTFTLRYPQPIRLTSVPEIYTSSALISAFDIPGSVAAQFPATPGTTPQYTVWGWKKRRDSSNILVAQGRVEENKDWVFAAWSRMPHVIRS